MNTSNSDERVIILSDADYEWLMDKLDSAARNIHELQKLVELLADNIWE